MIVFIDESGISERPTRVRTWALKGQTPIIQFHFNWNHVSIIAGLSRTNFLFRRFGCTRAVSRRKRSSNSSMPSRPISGSLCWLSGTDSGRIAAAWFGSIWTA